MTAKKKSPDLIREIIIKLVTEPILKAYVKIHFTNGLWISDIKVIESNGVLFVSFPKEKKKDKFFAIAGFDDREVKGLVCDSILKEYKNANDNK